MATLETASSPERSSRSSAPKTIQELVTFTHFQQTYGPSWNKNLSSSDAPVEDILAEEVLPSETSKASSSQATEEDEESQVDDKSWFFWELILYVPLILQSLFGTFNILRSLVIGHAFCWVLQQISSRTPQWLGLEQVETLLQKVDMPAASWAPPSLVVLVVFTITALVVHPDGLTWVFLRNLREAMVSLFRASCVCWSLVVHEHGAIISTMLALATFAALFFFTYALHKTLTPRSPPSSLKHQNSNNKSLQSSKKKKRKGNHGRGHRSGRTRASSQQQQRSKQEEPSAEHESSVKEAPHDSTAQPVLPSVQEDLPVVVSPPLETSESFADSVEQTNHGAPSLTARDRTMSNCTVDTISTVDTSGDQSVGSLSEDRSAISSVSVDESSSPASSVLPVLSPDARQPRSAKTKTSRQTAPNSTQRKNQNRRRGGRKGKDPRSKENSSANNSKSNQAPPQSTPSRWDALKPDNRAAEQHRRPPVYSPRTMNSPAAAARSAQQQNSRSPPPQDLAPGPKRSVPPPSPSTLLLGFCENGMSQWKPDGSNHSHAAAAAKNKVASIPPRNNKNSVATTSLASSSFVPSSNNMLPPPTVSLGSSPVAPVSQQSPKLSNFMGVKDLRSLPPPPGLAPISPSLTSSLPPAVSPPPVFSSASNTGASLPYYDSSSSSSLSGIPLIAEPPAPARRCVIKANPFATDDDDDVVAYAGVNNHRRSSMEDDQIEADLQELGGRMIGSILDF